MFNFSENLTRVFSKPENDYDGFRKMLFDYTHGFEVFDENGIRVPNHVINNKINSVCFDILQLDPSRKDYSRRELNRALKHNGVELMEVLEEVLDIKVTTGLQENEWFNKFVDNQNLKQGGRNEFWTDKDVILTVAKVSGDHHDLSMQKLGEGESFTVKTSNYAVKVGMDIDVYLTGRKDWSKFVDAVSIAFQEQIQGDMLTEIMSVGDKIPAPEKFHVTKEISAENKDSFDALLSDVSAANGGVDVIVLGLKTDLKKLNVFADVDWATDKQKEDMATLGRLGSYETTTLVEIPQRFVKNDVTKYLIKPGTLLIVPNVDDKFVKFVDVGETEIHEVTEKGARNDDFQTYEVQREMGIATICDRYIGVWTIA
ncbi:MAG: hypothetical protein ACLTWK_12030 [Eisenbergiella sp.]